MRKRDSLEIPPVFVSLLAPVLDAKGFAYANEIRFSASEIFGLSPKAYYPEILSGKACIGEVF